MGRLEQEERHALLPLSSSNSSNSTTLGSSSEDIINSDNENRVEFQEKPKYFRKKLAISLLSGGDRVIHQSPPNQQIQQLHQPYLLTIDESYTVIAVLESVLHVSSSVHS